MPADVNSPENESALNKPSTKRERDFSMGFLRIPVKLYFLTYALLFAMVGMVYYTVWTLENQKHDANLIYFAGKQRMLTQKLAKSLMELQLGNQNKIAEIKSIKQEFDKVLQGLMEGDKELGLSPAQTSGILDQFNQIQAIWVPYVMSIEQVVQFWPEISQSMQQIINNNDALYDEADGLVRELGKVMGSKTASASVGLRENLQRISRAVLQFQQYKTQKSVDEGRQSITTQNKLIQGLLNGNSSLNLKKVTAPGLRKKIENFKGHWKNFQTNVETAFENLPYVHQASDYISENNIPLLEAMDSVVLEMAAHSREKVVTMIQNEYKYLAILFILGTILSTFIIRRITHPLGNVTKKMEQMANGNFKQEKIDIKTWDEVGLMQNNFNRLIDSMNYIISQLNEIASGTVRDTYQLRRGDLEVAFNKMIMSTLKKED